MKKNKEYKNKKFEAQKDQEKKFKRNKTVVGFLTIIDGKDYLVAGKKKFLITGQRPEMSTHIKEKAKVKGVLRTKGKFDEPAVFLIKEMDPFVSIDERVYGVLQLNKVRTAFSRDCEEEAAKYGSRVLAKDKKDRLDLTDIDFCTIDGKTAKDFDDAVFARNSKKGIEVIVAIADVSHYVKEGSALDEEAFARSVSLYYPGHCVPMLPFNLSDGLCSLRPKVLRLGMSVAFLVSKKGEISDVSINQCVIKSKERLTYEEVQDFFDKKSVPKITQDLSVSLTWLKKAALILRKERHDRGAIDFDITESVVALDNAGEPVGIHPAQRLESHKIIEDLMVATNEIVARFLLKNKLGGVYRIHEPPSEEKFGNFLKSAQAFNALNKPIKADADFKNPKTVQSIMTSYEDSKYKDILNTLMLRAMMQAKYSDQNLKHFGLASEAYAHFTSPIRRYADLIVHRQIRNFLYEDKKKAKSKKSFAMIAESISEREAFTTDIERKIDKLYSCFFMKDKVGEIFEGVVTSCTDFGFFVRIKVHHVEGLVHISCISQNRVTFVPERMCLIVQGSNKTLSAGDKVKVKLANVNVDRGFIDFDLVDKI